MLAEARLGAEWLESDGLGGFASGTVDGRRTRRYHALLCAARTPPTGRMVLVAGMLAEVERHGVRTPLLTQSYVPGVLHPDGRPHLAGFRLAPWPVWTWRLPDGLELEQEVLASHEEPVVTMRWRLRSPAAGVRLLVRPLLAVRDQHALHHENDAFAFGADTAGGRVRWQPYAGQPGIVSLANAAYRHEPLWFRQFLLAEERARGFDAVEDLASPGELAFDLSAGAAWWVLGADGIAGAPHTLGQDAAREGAARRAAERVRRRSLGGVLARAGDQYLARRGTGRTIIAGFPWFTDWGRDTFIALRGLCLATGRLDDAAAILDAWAGTVSEGMLPNRFVDDGDAPEFNAVDASLWYAVAVHEWRAAMRAAGRRVPAARARRLTEAVQAILTGCAHGTRYGIRADADGLLACGEPGVQLTWMDARVGEWVVTPRVGKPVEVQALWINALRTGGPAWAALRARAERSFRARFWDAGRGALHDVVDVDHVPGTADPTLRPNQVLAVGGLPWPVLDGAEARAVVDAVERELLTPIGLRSLGPREPGYRPRYEGDPLARDGAYHQGTVWPWLLGPFVEAWLRVRGDTPAARRAARRRFLVPLRAHLAEAGLGHVAEIADADAPHRPRGCPFQAWSVGEALRLERLLAPRG